MPTAEAYDVLAIALDTQAEALEVVMVPLHPMVERDVMAGGLVRDELARRLDDDAGWIVVEVGQLRDAADECRRRAEVCRVAEAAAVAHAAAWHRYERELVAWRHDDTSGMCGPRPLPPTAPLKPPPWVEW